MAKKKSTKAKEKMLRITLVKSPKGYQKKQRATVEALGLRKIRGSVVVAETPQIRGMINKVSHLLDVEEVDGS